MPNRSFLKNQVYIKSPRLRGRKFRKKLCQSSSFFLTVNSQSMNNRLLTNHGQWMKIWWLRKLKGLQSTELGLLKTVHWPLFRMPHNHHLVESSCEVYKNLLDEHFILNKIKIYRKETKHSYFISLVPYSAIVFNNKTSWAQQQCCDWGNFL